MELIDRTKLPRTVSYCAETEHDIGFEEGQQSIIEAINDAPTVDAVPVVRCVDCKYRDAEITVSAPSESQYESITFASCPCKVFNLGDDFFCKKGKRKDGDSDGRTKAD